MVATLDRSLFILPYSSTSVDVLIVGAGPVGLFLADECVRGDLRCRFIEAHSGQPVHSKALATFPRTLEIFDMAGLVAEFLRAAPLKGNCQQLLLCLTRSIVGDNPTCSSRED